jgi:hypothetical protein
MPLEADIFLRQMLQQTPLVYCCQFKRNTADPLMNGLLVYEFQKQAISNGSEIVHSGNE